MAVALGTGTSAVNLTPGAYSTAVTSSSWTISGSNLAIFVIFATDADVASPSLSWSLGSGTVAQVLKQPDPVTTDLWTWAYVIPAPNAGTGTYTLTLSGTPNFQCSAVYFTGCDQADPSPVGDAVGNNTSPGPWTITPTNIGANDAMVGAHTHSQSGDSNGWTTGTLIYESNSTPINLLTGYRLGASSMVAADETGGGIHVTNVGVRVQAATGAAAVPPILANYAARIV